MPLLKALQDKGLGPEHYEYVKAMQLYRQACSRYARVPKDFRFSDNQLKRLQFFNERELYVLECKKFHVARAKWLTYKAEQKLGAELTPAKIAELLQLEIPSTQKELLDDAKKQAIADSFKDGELEKLAQEVRERAEARESLRAMTTKQQFMSPANDRVRDDPTFGDDAPLPE